MHAFMLGGEGRIRGLQFDHELGAPDVGEPKTLCLIHVLQESIPNSLLGDTDQRLDGWHGLSDGAAVSLSVRHAGRFRSSMWNGKGGMGYWVREWQWSRFTSESIMVRVTVCSTSYIQSDTMSELWRRK